MTDYQGKPDFDSALHKELTFAVSGEVMKELIRTRIQFLGAPYLRSAQGGVSLQVVADKSWVDWPSLEDVLTKRMNADLNSGTALSSHQYGLVAYSGGGVTVRIQYLMDDYWWVECLFPSIEDFEEWNRLRREGPAAATMHVANSRFNLADTSGNPLWFSVGG